MSQSLRARDEASHLQQQPRHLRGGDSGQGHTSADKPTGLLTGPFGALESVISFLSQTHPLQC